MTNILWYGLTVWLYTQCYLSLALLFILSSRHKIILLCYLDAVKPVLKQVPVVIWSDSQLCHLTQLMSYYYKSPFGVKSLNWTEPKKKVIYTILDPRFWWINADVGIFSPTIISSWNIRSRVLLDGPSRDPRGFVYRNKRFFIQFDVCSPFCSIG